MTLPGNLGNLLTRLWYHLSRRRQRQFGLLLGLMLVSAFAEVISLGAVLPFLGILTAPDTLFNQPLVMDLTKTWGISTADQLASPYSSICRCSLSSGSNPYHFIVGHYKARGCQWCRSKY
jgi:ATP-binding cassette, subfamily B, bacterial PglK